MVGHDSLTAADRRKLATTKGFCFHGNNPDAKRPPHVSVEWFGRAEPVNAQDTDSWTKPK